MIVAGLGCRTGVGANEIAVLVSGAATAAGLTLAALAAPAFKAAEPGVIAAAALLGLPMIWVSPADLASAQPRCVTRSVRAAAAVGVASVAEGCALAAAGADAVLLVPRTAGRHATCAIAGVRA